MMEQESQQEIPRVVIEHNRYAFVIDEEVEVEPADDFGWDSMGNYLTGEGQDE